MSFSCFVGMSCEERERESERKFYSKRSGEGGDVATQYDSVCGAKGNTKEAFEIADKR